MATREQVREMSDAEDAAAAGVHVVGVVRRYDTRKLYGFITVLSEGDHNGQDIFVHQSNIQSTNVMRDKMLYIGECVEFNIVPSTKSDFKFQAVSVHGYGTNPLMCDNGLISFRRHSTSGPRVAMRDDVRRSDSGAPQSFQDPRRRTAYRDRGGFQSEDRFGNRGRAPVAAAAKDEFEAVGEGDEL
jgi:cold shock CspA family protein